MRIITLLAALLILSAPALAQTSVQRTSRPTFSPSLAQSAPTEEELRRQQQQRAPSTASTQLQINNRYPNRGGYSGFSSGCRPGLTARIVDGVPVCVPAGKTLVAGPGQDNIHYRTITPARTSINHVPARRDFAREVIRWPKTALKLWDVPLTGRGASVALLDMGVARHSELNPPASVQVLNLSNPQNTQDMLGHGNAIAGILTAAGSRGAEFSVAPGMALRSYKITDDDEAGTTNSLLVKDAVEHILRYNAQSGADKVNIINISYGLDSDNAELREVFKKAYDSGVTIIASAGNGANARLVYPAAYDFVISVGAATKNGQIYPSSSYGKIDFMAPGEDIFTIDGNNGYIALEGGTSYAAAYITGLAALITEAYLAKTGRRPTPAEVYGTLAKISLKMPNVQAQRQGHGMPDASKITGVI